MIELDYARERAVQEALRELIRAELVRSAHDCSEGGLGVALAECCFRPEGSLGAEIDLTGTPQAPVNQLLFNETQSRVIISVSRGNAGAALALAQWRGIPARRLGNVVGADLKIAADGKAHRWELAALRGAWQDSISNCMSA